MARIALDGKGLTTLGRMKRLPLRTVGTPYLVHCALGELFGDHAPKPYSIVPSSGSREVHVLGYTDADKDGLTAQAEIGASPTVYELCDWEHLAVKPMPDRLPKGLTLGYELRACPVIRKSSAGSAETPGGERTWREGEELDAFLDAAWTRPDDDLSREQVYSDWLRRQLDLRGGAALHTVGMERFSIERMTRRNHNGSGTTRQIKRPDVTLTGTLQVTDSDAFHQLLRSGIGQHKTFGYGMLKIRRA